MAASGTAPLVMPSGCRCRVTAEPRAVASVGSVLPVVGARRYMPGGFAPSLVFKVRVPRGRSGGEPGGRPPVGAGSECFGRGVGTSGGQNESIGPAGVCQGPSGGDPQTPAGAGPERGRSGRPLSAQKVSPTTASQPTRPLHRTDPPPESPPPGRTQPRPRQAHDPPPTRPLARGGAFDAPARPRARGVTVPLPLGCEFFCVSRLC